jgi:hypothetical protein
MARKSRKPRRTAKKTTPKSTNFEIGPIGHSYLLDEKANLYSVESCLQWILRTYRAQFRGYSPDAEFVYALREENHSFAPNAFQPWMGHHWLTRFRGIHCMPVHTGQPLQLQTWITVATPDKVYEYTASSAALWWQTTMNILSHDHNPLPRGHLQIYFFDTFFLGIQDVTRTGGRVDAKRRDGTLLWLPRKNPTTFSPGWQTLWFLMQLPPPQA